MFMKVGRTRKEMSNFVLFVLSCVVLVHCEENLPSVQMLPAMSQLPILEGDTLQLECIHKYAQQSSTEFASFQKNNNDISVSNSMGYEITTSTTMTDVVNSVMTTKKTLRKNVTTTEDQGTFNCIAPGKSTTIKILIVKITPKDANFSGSEPAVLRCEMTGWTDAVTYSWKGVSDVALVGGDKYQIFNNGSLVINKPSRDDLGEYKCTVTFNPTSVTEKYVITPKPAALRGAPEIVSNDNSKNMVEGDKLELKCKATGFPKPTIKWYKDNKELNTTLKLHFSEYEGIATAKLIIFDLTYDDAGSYSCMAENEIAPFNATKVMELRVKDKLAALWPFLGIVAEVVVLCVIILLYEKRRSKKLTEEDDAVDGNEENTVEDHKEVRHRRT